MNLIELREEASFYCATCSFAEQQTPAATRCLHPDRGNGLEAVIIPLSTGKCPKGSWDHTTIEFPKPREKSANSTPAPAGSTKPEVIAVPRDQWPDDVVQFAGRRIEGEIGVGDTLHRLMGSTDNVRTQAEWLLKAITGNCACWSRVRKANRLFPYGLSSCSATAQPTGRA